KDRVIRLGATARHLLQLPAPERTVPMYRGDGVTVVRRRFGPEDWNCEFALRLASSPETVEVWAGQNLEHGLEWLLAFPIVARAARCLVLAIDRESPTFTANDGQLYRGWRWQ